MARADALVRGTHERLDGLARRPSDHPASGGYGTRLRRLGLTGAEVHAAARDLARECRALEPRTVVAVAQALVDGGRFEGGIVAFELLWRHRAAAAGLTARDLARLARGADNWVTTDSFACLVSGPAWHRHQVPDAFVARWARSRDAWLRRIALVSTVPLNLPSRGGTGDVPRALRTCSLLVADHEDMVAKAMSWALREVAKRDPVAVRAFLARHRTALAARVVREVTNKLTTGRKNPRPAARAAASRLGVTRRPRGASRSSAVAQPRAAHAGPPRATRTARARRP